MIGLDDAAEIMQRVRAVLEADRVGPRRSANQVSIGLERYSFACYYCQRIYRPHCRPFNSGDGYGRIRGKPRDCQRRALEIELADAEEELVKWLDAG